MADRNIPVRSGIGTFRTEFNELAGDDGDIATLSGY